MRKRMSELLNVFRSIVLTNSFRQVLTVCIAISLVLVICQLFFAPTTQSTSTSSDFNVCDTAYPLSLEEAEHSLLIFRAEGYSAIIWSTLSDDQTLYISVCEPDEIRSYHLNVPKTEKETFKEAILANNLTVNDVDDHIVLSTSDKKISAETSIPSSKWNYINKILVTWANS